MKKIKLLWSIAFAFAIVLFYATVTSLFVKPYSDWYLALPKPDFTPGSTVISIGWAINYVLSIALLTRIIYRHDELRSAALLIAIGVLQIVWGAVFFTAHSLFIGVIVEILIIFIGIIALAVLSKRDFTGFMLFTPVLIWYIYCGAVGLRLLFFNS